jgi:dTDP-4-dehydrorhamnose reductase
MKALIVGVAGMVGHILFYGLQERNIDVIGIARNKSKMEKNVISFDLYNDWVKINRFLRENKFDIIVNCVAILGGNCNVNQLQAVYINSLLPHRLVDLFKNTETKIIHLSSGGVFSGEDEFYLESDPVSPKNYYGITKAAGEFSNVKDLVVRSDFWGPDAKKHGTGLFNWFLNQNKDVKAYKTVFFNGISNFELSRLLLELIQYTGIIHIGATEIITKGEFLAKIKQVFNLDHITLISDDSVYKRMFLKSIRTLPYVKNHEQMIKDIWQYMLAHQDFYKDIYPQLF